MLSVTVGDWSLSLDVAQLPLQHGEAKENAVFYDEVSAPGETSRGVFIGVSKTENTSGHHDAVLIVEFQGEGGFEPGVLLVPETQFLFIGAGESLLGYDLERRERAFEDYVFCGFWGWHRFDDVVLMSAETECSAWSLIGRKLWSTDVEPPWDLEVVGSDLILNIGGVVRNLDLKTGNERAPD